MAIYDITRTVSPELSMWPGDDPFSFTQTAFVSKGDIVNLTRLSISPHTGTHIDAHFHISDEGGHPATLDLSKYLGKAHVASVTRKHGGIIPEDFADADLTNVERLLIHTWVSEVEDSAWPNDYPYPTPELIHWLHEKGAVLIGVDMPSVDGFDSTDLPVHHLQFSYGMVNLERICLDGVPDGVYELIALPLKIDGICGSPVRAILRTL